MLLLVALILGGFGVRRVGRGGGSGLLTATAILAFVALVAYMVAVWAMGASRTDGEEAPRARMLLVAFVAPRELSWRPRRPLGAPPQRTR